MTSDWGDYPLYSRASVGPGSQDSIAFDYATSIDSNIQPVTLTLEGRVMHIIKGLEQIASEVSLTPIQQKMERFEKLKIDAATYSKLNTEESLQDRMTVALADARRSVLNDLTGKTKMPGSFGKGYSFEGEPYIDMDQVAELGLTVMLKGPRQRPVDGEAVAGDAVDNLLGVSHDQMDAYIETPTPSRVIQPPFPQGGGFKPGPSRIITPDEGDRLIKPAVKLADSYGSMGSEPRQKSSVQDRSGWPMMGWRKKK